MCSAEQEIGVSFPIGPLRGLPKRGKLLKIAPPCDAGKARSSGPEVAVFHFRDGTMERGADVAMGAAGAEPGMAENFAVEGGAARVHAREVTQKLRIGRIGLQKGDAIQAGGQELQADDQLVIGYVIEAVAADDEVVGAGQVGEMPERTREEVAPLSKAPDGIGAGVDAGVGGRGAQLFQDRLPLAFSATDVQNGADGPLQVVFGDSQREKRLAGGLA